MKTKVLRPLCLAAVLTLVAAGCGDDDTATTTATTVVTTTTTVAATTGATTTTTTTEATTTTAEGHGTEELEIEAVPALITVDGDPADWEGIEGLDFTLQAIQTETLDPKEAIIKVAFDHDFLYVLFTVVDDFDWEGSDAHMSGSAAVMWAIEAAAGPHMGTDEEGEEEDYTSLGMVDIWHWELGCALGAEQGGSVSGPGEGSDPGDDGGCNFDDEWSTDPETREDDNGDGAENSLLGVFGHSNPVAGGEGAWTFEIRRPLQTGDAQDAQFAVGETVKMALAYWDPDNSPEGWDDAEHVQSSYLGWIHVTLMGE